MERLGETMQFGSLLLQILSLHGWAVAVVPAFAGEGVLVIARKGGVEVKREGASVADVSVDVFKEASSMRRLAAA